MFDDVNPWKPRATMEFADAGILACSCEVAMNPKRLMTTGGAALLAFVIAGAHPGASSRRAQPTSTAHAFELTVDSIMRGPKLVGYPPSALRWSADSKSLYF